MDYFKDVPGIDGDEILEKSVKVKVTFTGNALAFRAGDRSGSVPMKKKPSDAEAKKILLKKLPYKEVELVWVKDLAEAKKDRKPIKVYVNKDYGIESHVIAVWGKENLEGYGVRLKDTDAGKFLDITKIFPNESDAHDYAKHLVKK